MFKKFKFYISESMGPTYSLTLRKGKWYYETENDWQPVEMLVDNFQVTPSQFSNNEIITHIDSIPSEITPSTHRLNRLHKYLKQYCKHWKKEYAWMQYCDGVMWECDIEGEDFKLKARGHVEEPGNFELFLHKLTVFTEGKYFGPSIY
jgi:hypothetical protein